jgi:NADH-quinone oxidoreductase subunit M
MGLPSNDILIFSIGVFCLSLRFSFYLMKRQSACSLSKKAKWFPEWGIEYFIGIDGISLLLVLLTTFLTVICILCSWNDIKIKVKEYYCSFLLLETAMIGTLCSLTSCFF